MTTREQDVRLADGRVLRVLDTGPADGHAVLVCHGTPASRRLHDGWVTAAADAGLRLISYDRPGYGGSSSQPGRTIADTASDVAAIADDLGLDRFAVWGPSAGGGLIPGRSRPSRTQATGSFSVWGPACRRTGMTAVPRWRR